MQRGRSALVIAKFFPGLSTVAPPLAGMVGIARWQFIVLDIAARHPVSRHVDGPRLRLQ